MEDVFYKLKIDEHDFEFNDNWEDEDSISNFEIVMDMYPVYHAYKYRDSLETVETKQVVNIASTISDKLLSFHQSKIYSYKSIMNLVNVLQKHEEIFNTYNRIVRVLHVEDPQINNENFTPSIDTSQLDEFVKNIPTNNYRIKNAFKDTYEHFINKGKIRLLTKNNKHSFNRSLNYYLTHRLNHELFLNFNCINEACCLLNKKTIAHYNLHYLEKLRTNLDDYLNNALSFCKKTLRRIPKSTDSNFIKLMQDIDDNINQHFEGKEPKKYSHKGAGCFAIMALSKDFLYYAISGLRRRENNPNVVKLCTDIEKLFKVKMKRCCVTDKMVRYKDDNKTFTTFIQELPANSAQDKDIECLYTCCERKILANLSTSPTNGRYFIRWAPCPKCIPALQNNYSAIYAFSPSSKQRNYDSSQMTRYKITPNFELEEI